MPIIPVSEKLPILPSHFGAFGERALPISFKPGAPPCRLIR